MDPLAGKGSAMKAFLPDEVGLISIAAVLRLVSAWVKVD
jgi:hypothetical protein